MLQIRMVKDLVRELSICCVEDALPTFSRPCRSALGNYAKYWKPHPVHQITASCGTVLSASDACWSRCSEEGY